MSFPSVSGLRSNLARIFSNQSGLHRLNTLQTRMLLIGLLPALLIAVLLTAYFARLQVIEAERDARTHLLTASQALATAVEYAMISGNRSLLAQTLSRERAALRLDYARACDIDHVVLARCGWLAEKNLPKTPIPVGQVIRHEDAWFAMRPILLPDTSFSTDSPEFADPEASSRKIVGYVMAGLSVTPVATAQRQVITQALALILVALLLTLFAAWQLSKRLATRISLAADAVDRIARGELATRLAVSAGKETERLEQGINRLAETLLASQLNMKARIAEATSGLAAKKEEAERANIAKSRFFAAASHDLRQPLHALALFAGALKEHPRYPDIKALADHIDASVSTMETLLNSLLDISRLDAGVLEVNMTHFPANRLFDRIRQQYGGVAREKGLRFKVRPCALTLHTDPVLLERILFNLVSNAIRYTNDGGLLIACRKRGRNALIQVIDTGLGIPENAQEVVFQEFVQLGNPARDRNKGLGLGLAIVSRLARLLGQRVHLRSLPGQGSIFGVEVPLGSSRETEQNAKHLPAPAQTRLEGRLVALIDDEEPILRAMEELFDSWRIELITARNVEEAVDWLSSLGRKPDLLITDYRLPGDANGIEIVNYLRLCFGPQLPALILTGDTAPETLQRISEAGMTVLHKPVRPARLRALLMHLLEKASPPEK